MAVLYKDDPAAGWRLTYRFRYRADDQIDESDDRKSWYELTSDEGDHVKRDAIIAAVDHGVIEIEAFHRGAQIFRVPIRGGMAAFTAALKAQPWMNLRRVLFAREPELPQ